MSNERRRQPQDVESHQDSGCAVSSCESANKQFTDDELYDHIVAMGLELRRLTKSSDMRFLTYLLEMVVEEAATAPRRTRH